MNEQGTGSGGSGVIWVQLGALNVRSITEPMLDYPACGRKVYESDFAREPWWLRALRWLVR